MNIPYAAEAALDSAGDTLLLGGVLPPYNPVIGAGGGPQTATPRRRVWRTRFMPEHVYEYFARAAAITAASLPPGHLRHREIPPEFLCVFPLDRTIAAADMGLAAAPPPATGTFGYVSNLFKVISADTGMPAALRRVEGARAPPAVLNNAVVSWSRAAHPAVIPLRRAFSSGSAVFFVHDFFPGARSLRELYLDAPAPPPRGAPPPPPPSALPESFLWSVAVQLTAALRVVHEAGLTFRGVRAAHVLVTGRNRLRLAGAGVYDVLEAEHAPQPHAAMARADVISLGHLLLQLATRNAGAHASHAVAASLAAVEFGYSHDLAALIHKMLSKAPSALELVVALAPRLSNEYDAMLDHTDALEAMLAREADNGRLLRLLLRLGFVNERPEHDGDGAWAETGERYLLKLFRSWVFHSTDDNGRPIVDLAHALDALNLLDVGSPTRVLLSSRDGSSILVSSYSALRSALGAAFDELREAASAGSPSSQQAAPTLDANDADSWRPKVPSVVRFRSAATVGGRGARAGRGGFSHVPRTGTFHHTAAQMAAVAAGGYNGDYAAHQGGGNGEGYPGDPNGYSQGNHMAPQSGPDGGMGGYGGNNNYGQNDGYGGGGGASNGNGSGGGGGGDGSPYSNGGLSAAAEFYPQEYAPPQGQTRAQWRLDAAAAPEFRPSWNTEG